MYLWQNEITDNWWLKERNNEWHCCRLVLLSRIILLEEVEQIICAFSGVYTCMLFELVFHEVGRSVFCGTFESLTCLLKPAFLHFLRQHLAPWSKVSCITITVRAIKGFAHGLNSDNVVVNGLEPASFGLQVMYPCH